MLQLQKCIFAAQKYSHRTSWVSSMFFSFRTVARLGEFSTVHLFSCRHGNDIISIIYDRSDKHSIHQGDMPVLSGLIVKFVSGLSSDRYINAYYKGTEKSLRYLLVDEIT